MNSSSSTLEARRSVRFIPSATPPTSDVEDEGDGREEEEEWMDDEEAGRAQKAGLERNERRVEVDEEAALPHDLKPLGRDSVVNSLPLVPPEESSPKPTPRR